MRGEVEVLINLRDRRCVIRACSLPTLALPCIFGMDSLKAFGVFVNFARGT